MNFGSPTAYTEEQKAEFKREFGKRKTRQIAGFVATVGSMIAIMILPEALSFPFGKTGPPLPFIVGPVFIISSIFNWRCPACNKALGGELSARYCSNCGVELQ